MMMPHDALWSNTSVSASIGLRRERVLAGLHVQVRTLARDPTCREHGPAALTWRRAHPRVRRKLFAATQTLPATCYHQRWITTL